MRKMGGGEREGKLAYGIFYWLQKYMRFLKGGGGHFCAPSTVSGRDGGNGWVWMLSSHDVQICLLLKEIGHLFLLGPVLLGTVKCIQIRFCGRVFFTAVLLGWVTCNCLFFRFPLTAYTSVSPTLQRFGLFCLVW